MAGRAGPAGAPLAPPAGARPVRYAHEVPSDPHPPDWFDIPVRGARVGFVYDVSGSMRSKLPLAYTELKRAVKGLGSTRQFEVVFFNEQVMPWRGRLSRADPVTKELLVRHLDEVEVKSYTNLFDALETTLGLGVDEVFAISDGEPNRGRARLPRRILAELRRINVRRVPIHTVSVVRKVDGDEHVELLRAIAAQSGGRHVARDVY
ncbi:MAG: VWA domain-containing protein [Planctomycetota bacterium]